MEVNVIEGDSGGAIEGGGKVGSRVSVANLHLWRTVLLLRYGRLNLGKLSHTPSLAGYQSVCSAPIAKGHDVNPGRKCGIAL